MAEEPALPGFAYCAQCGSVRPVRLQPLEETDPTGGFRGGDLVCAHCRHRVARLYRRRLDDERARFEQGGWRARRGLDRDDRVRTLMALALQPDHFEVLRVRRQASRDLIERSYRLLLRRYSLLEADGPEERAAIEALRGRIEAAYAALTDAPKRARDLLGLVNDRGGLPR
jgi:hypothetical protein